MEDLKYEDLPEGTKQVLDNIEVKIGHPNDPDRGTLRSEDDEKRIDDQGRPVVDGLPWSQAKTDMFLVIAVSKGGLVLDRKINGMSYDKIPGSDHFMTVGVTQGKPVPITPFAGSCLELPVDLGSDAKKRQYVAEWVAETAVESLQLTGSTPSDPKENQGHGSRVSSVGLWVSAATESAIRSVGL